MRRYPLFAYTSLVVLLGCASAVAAPGDIYYIPTFGGPRSVGADVNDSGVAVGFADVTGSGNHAFRFSVADGILDLGTLGGASSFATAVNNAGVVTGAAGVNNVTSRGFRYDGSGPMQSIGALSTGSSTAYHVNNRGTIVGESDTQTSVHSFRHTPATGIRDMALPTPQVATARAIDGNDDLVAGDFYPAGGGHHPFAYRTSTDTFYDGGSLGGTAGYALAVNDVGVAVGWATNASGQPRAFRFRPGAPLQELASLGGAQSFASDITDGDVIVGSALTSGGASHACAWLAGGGVVDLDVWLDSVNPSPGAHWTLNHAEGISETGWITGDGTYDDGPGGELDGQRAFLLDAAALVPEPTAVATLGSAGAMLLLSKRRRACVRRRDRRNAALPTGAPRSA